MPPNNSPRIRISLVQVLASAMAAATAAVAGSFLGVNGTVIGAAIASVLSVAGTAIYSHSLERTSTRVRTAVPVSTRWLPARPDASDVDLAPTAVLPPVGPHPDVRRRTRPLARIGLAAAVVFVAALAVITSVEVVAGKPISDLLRGTTASGTTVFGSQQNTASSGPTTTTPTPAVTVTVVPHVVVTTPTVTSTAPAVTVTPSTSSSSPSPTATSTPTDSATNSTSTGP